VPEGPHTKPLAHWAELSQDCSDLRHAPAGTTRSAASDKSAGPKRIESRDFFGISLIMSQAGAVESIYLQISDKPGPVIPSLRFTPVREIIAALEDPP
jgi:hypothetical protein